MLEKGQCKVAEEGRILNSTCNALAGFAQTLAGIKLFQAIIGQANAAKVAP